jgi:2-dehydropantoate 2-reductase
VKKYIMLNATHVVFGAGLIGGYLAGHLVAQCPNASIKVVARDSAKAHFTTAATITDMDEHRLDSPYPPQWVETLDAVKADCDYLWLTVKCTAVKAACDVLQGILPKHTVILCCQNGIGSDDIIRTHFPDNPVLRVMFPFNVVQHQTAHWHRSSSGTVAIEASQKLPELDEFVQAMNCPTMPLTTTLEMDALLWAKCQINLTNSVNALANCSLQETLLNRHYRKLIAALMLEHLKVCKAMNISLPKITQAPAWLIPHIMQLPDWLFPRVAKQMVAIDPAAKLSMWWDLDAGRETEIDFINGATVRFGNRVNVPTPANAAVISIIKQLQVERANGQSRRSISAQEIINL